MKQYFKIVKHVLEKTPQSRDDDQVLYSHVLAEFNFNIFKEPAWNLITKISKKQLPSVDSVTRVRRMLQERHIELRGELWSVRHGLKQEKAKSDLGYPNMLDRALSYA